MNSELVRVKGGQTYINKDEKLKMKDDNHDWQWRTVQGNSYLTCNLLCDWQHGFFTKEFYPQTPEALTSILQSPTTAFRVKQVHGNAVLTPKQITTTIKERDLVNSFPDADAVISDAAKQSVWVASADCTPILIGDRLSGRVCAIHAGWRGTAQKIAVKAISRFIEFGSKKENMRIAIGPAIAGSMYQVDESVAIEVCKTIVTGKTDVRILKELKQIPHSPLKHDELPAKVRLDVSEVNRLQLEQLGIDPNHIAIARDYCTYQQNNIFFSYRRTAEKKVQWSGIVSN